MSVQSMFQSGEPVSGADFAGRERELDVLLKALRGLPQGQRRRYCVLGPRKIGKTSLFEELSRRLEENPHLLTSRVDLYEANTPDRFFVRYALQLVDAYLQRRGGEPLLSGLLDDEAALTLAAARLESLGERWLDRALAAVLSILRRERSYGRHFAPLLDLPQHLARETALCPVVMIDEFQELLRFGGFKQVRESMGDLLKTLRARWQKHPSVVYLVSGSEISLLESTFTSAEAPLFGQLIPMRLDPFPAETARRFLADRFRRSGLAISPAHVDRLVTLTSGHPFYLQVLGEDLCLRAREDAVDDGLLKETVQETLLSATGRLYLHFNGVLQRAAGRSSTLERVLVSLGAGSTTVTAIATSTGQQTGAVSSALGQLLSRDVVVRREDGSWAVQDTTFAHWLTTTRTGVRSHAGPYLLGDETERFVAESLAREGFRLVYRSLHSRGAFDLLAVLGTTQVGVQVKRASRLPHYLPLAEIRRLKDWGGKLGWQPVLAIHEASENRALFFDVRRAGRRTRKGLRFDQDEACDTLLGLI